MDSPHGMMPRFTANLTPHSDLSSPCPPTQGLQLPYRIPSSLGRRDRESFELPSEGTTLDHMRTQSVDLSQKRPRVDPNDHTGSHQRTVSMPHVGSASDMDQPRPMSALQVTPGQVDSLGCPPDMIILIIRQFKLTDDQARELRMLSSVSTIDSPFPISANHGDLRWSTTSRRPQRLGIACYLPSLQP